MGVSPQGFLAMCYSFGVVFAVALASYAFLKGYQLRRKIVNTESFVTARNQVRRRRWLYPCAVFVVLSTF
jgi:hypothetical protein